MQKTKKKQKELGKKIEDIFNKNKIKLIQRVSWRGKGEKEKKRKKIGATVHKSKYII